MRRVSSLYSFSSDGRWFAWPYKLNMKTRANPPQFGNLKGWIRKHRIALAVCLAGAVAEAMAISCAPFMRTVVAPPQIEGATFAGSKSCEQCHEEITKGFNTATHARLKAEGRTR